MAGDPALLRVFVDGGPAGAATGAPMPPARAVFHDGENEVYVADIPLTAGPVPARPSEGDLRASANAMIPGEVVRPGLDMVVHVDPERLLGGLRSWPGGFRHLDACGSTCGPSPNSR